MRAVRAGERVGRLGVYAGSYRNSQQNLLLLRKPGVRPVSVAWLHSILLQGIPASAPRDGLFANNTTARHEEDSDVNSVFLQQIFSRFNASPAALEGDGYTGGSCVGGLDQAVEHVVDQISSRLRAVPHYVRTLREPVATTLRCIDGIVESIPGAIHCCRDSFVEDPKINAFFVSPQHMQEIFSQSKEVRELFDADPSAIECWALMCMHKEERSQFGVALIDGEVRKDVLRTAVSFTDHQVVSPGVDEASARCALKCCMFDGLLAHIRRHGTQAKCRVEDIENRARSMRQRLRALDARSETDPDKAELAGKIRDLELELGAEDLRLSTINDHLAYVAQALANPTACLHAEQRSIRLNRMAIKLDEHSQETGYDLCLSEISIASHQTRVGSLVRFPRAELLPRQDFLKEADLFLSL